MARFIGAPEGELYLNLDLVTRIEVADHSVVVFFLEDSRVLTGAAMDAVLAAMNGRTSSAADVDPRDMTQEQLRSLSAAHAAPAESVEAKAVRPPARTARRRRK